MRTGSPLIVLVLTVLLIGLVSACAGSTSGSSTTAGQPADGATLLQERCTVCHALDRVTSKQLAEEGWAQVVDRMVGRGAELTEAEQATLVAYLAETYGP